MKWRWQRYGGGFGLWVLASCASTAGRDWQYATWVDLHASQNMSLRGISVVDQTTIWASGSGGTVLRSTDGGHSWQNVAPVDSRSCDFRDVHAFDARCAVVMVAGQPARLYRTDDGGAAWRVVFEDADPAAFFDSLAFDGDRGFVFGDPQDGAFCLLASRDGGASWQRVSPATLPAPAGAEAGFAASGTCLTAVGGRIAVATGGAASRLLASADDGVSWSAVPLPLVQGEPSQGAFSIAVRGSRAVVVGGDYRVPERSDGSAAWSADGGATWQACSGGAGGYRSGALWLDEANVLAVGERGASLSRDRGVTWQGFGDRGFHAVAGGRDGSVFACGSGGRIARLVAGKTGS